MMFVNSHTSTSDAARTNWAATFDRLAPCDDQLRSQLSIQPASRYSGRTSVPPRPKQRHRLSLRRVFREHEIARTSGMIVRSTQSVQSAPSDAEGCGCVAVTPIIAMQAAPSSQRRARYFSPDRRPRQSTG